MAEFKLVIGFKGGKCAQREVKDEQAQQFLGKRIGDNVKGDGAGLSGYEFEITGGSDNCGFPMRRDVKGAGRKRIFAVKGTGVKKKEKGIKQRKTVCGNKIYENISQINLKVLKQGKENLLAAEAKAEDKPAEKPKEVKKEEEPKKEEKPVEKPKEAKETEVSKPQKEVVEEPKKEAPKVEEKPKEEAK